MNPTIQAFFDTVTQTISYVIFDEAGGRCAIIDPVLDYDPKAGKTLTHNADKLIAFIHAQRLSVQWILETHAHADHLSSADYLKNQLGGKIGIGQNIPAVQKTFKKIFNFGDEFIPDGHHFDHLFSDGELFQIGKITAKAIAVSGHTPADIAYRINDVIFVGDTLFMPDVGTARADFPGGDARQLFKSIQKILAFPPETRLLMCHDYPPTKRPEKWESTVAEQRAHNIHVHTGVTEDEFVKMRTERDATLEMPNLLLPAIQINIRGGKLPPVESNGVAYFKIPINLI
ncbi:MBL fold metallo-hydrolase [Nitrosomonas ureae]|uniref:Glyoxylase, beta-lactamase superfamily II n=1 Tax=Nitrosomonas ureae TaxID=44577 RepID=A0A1H5XR06_9PROT|nr:MBL fold metallo-hydrolase [Nitrosomonas ureae]SEG13925.1 Glyoxylase, beta-lactamase superfamily II [Nitrosomonas ureae]